MTGPVLLAPDPVDTRRYTLEELQRLGLPLPPITHPMLWDAGDRVELRATGEIEARIAVLNVVLARAYGMPKDLAVTWLNEAGLFGALTGNERSFVRDENGDPQEYMLQHEAVFALAWILGIAMDLDPARPAADGLTRRLPDLPAAERYDQWRGRALVAPRSAREIVTTLDLYYCLDWSCRQVAQEQAEQAQQHQMAQAIRGRAAQGKAQAALAGRLGAVRLPVDPIAVIQRRLALEWVLILHRCGPVAGVDEGADGSDIDGDDGGGAATGGDTGIAPDWDNVDLTV